jgi:hypothetical protein
MEKQLTAVEWLINEIDMQYPDINVKNKEWMIDKAKAMEEDGKHASYLYGHEVGYKKANELWEVSRKVAENQPRLK